MKFSLLCFLVLLFGSAAAQKADPLSRSDSSALRKYEQRAAELLAEGKKNQATRFLNKAAFLHWEHGYSEKALGYFQKSLTLNEQIGNMNAIMMINNNIAMNYTDLKQYDKALEHFRKTLELRRERKEKVGVASALNNIANVYSAKGEPQNAVLFLEEALTIATELSNRVLMRDCYGKLSEAYEKLGNSERSIYYYKFYTSFTEEIRRREREEAQERIREAALQAKLAEMEKKAREYELYVQKKELRKKDSAMSDLEYEKEEAERMTREQIELRNKEKAVNEARAKEQQARMRFDKLLRYIFIGGFVVALLFLFVVFRNYKQQKAAHEKLGVQNMEIFQQKEEIQTQRDNIEAKSMELETALFELNDKNFKLTGSINYAKRIQDAMLPDPKKLEQILPESFVLFKPRDIVSGDFYWFTEMDFQPVFRDREPKAGKAPSSIFENFESRKVVIAAVDCTGHGVPGAFMSMIGFNLLNEVVAARNIHEPDKILSELHKGIRQALKQEETENRDGMDMAVCMIDKEEDRLHFAGAKNPLILIQDGEVKKIKGDKYPIGGVQKEEVREFTNRIIKLDKPTVCYIFSDGYQDQFGGAEGRKFMIKRLRHLLLEIHQKPMSEQRRILDRTISDWMKDERQIDDILVVGFKYFPDSGSFEV